MNPHDRLRCFLLKPVKIDGLLLLSCKCMETAIHIDHALWGYEHAAEVTIVCNFYTILIANVMRFVFWSMWLDYSIFWLLMG